VYTSLCANERVESSILIAKISVLIRTSFAINIT
jgi:hypothetical protein